MGGKGEDRRGSKVRGGRDWKGSRGRGGGKGGKQGEGLGGD